MPEPYFYQDPEMYHRLYDTFYIVMVMYSMTITGDQAESEDIVQDVFVTMWRRGLAFDNEIKLKVYLYSAVRNNSIDVVKHRKVAAAYAENVQQNAGVYSVDINQNEEPFGEEVYRHLFAAIDLLPARQREIILKAMEGKSNLEIAAQLAISVDTVKTHKKRAKDFLRKKLGGQDFAMLMLILPV